MRMIDATPFCESEDAAATHTIRAYEHALAYVHRVAHVLGFLLNSR
jgi:hypothetical protein